MTGDLTGDVTITTVTGDTVTAAISEQNCLLQDGAVVVVRGEGGQIFAMVAIALPNAPASGLSNCVARWQNLIPSFPWIAPGWRAWGCNPRKGRDQILQRSVA